MVVSALRSSLQRWQTLIGSDSARYESSESLDQSTLGDRVYFALYPLIVLRILECWGIEPDGQLATVAEGSDPLARLQTYLLEVGDRYHLSFLHPALCQDGRLQANSAPSLLSTPLLHEFLSDLYQPTWTHTLSTDPAAALDQLQQGEAKNGRSQSRQKSYGAYYTPADIVDQMVTDALHAYRQNHELTVSFRVLDPACGVGAFLTAVCKWWMDYLDRDASLERRSRLGIANWRSPQTLSLALLPLYGVDLDRYAVEMTKVLLVLTVLQHCDPPIIQRRAIAQSLFATLDRQIRWGNAVIAPDIMDFGSTPTETINSLRPFNWHHEFGDVMASGGFDLVIGNPPYLDSEWMTRYMAIERSYCTRHYQSAVGNWDLFCIFVEQAFKLCRPGGFTSLIVPNKLQSAPYAARVRQILACENTLLQLRDYSQVSCFPVAVYPIVYLAQKQPPQQPQPIQYHRMGNLDNDASTQSSYTIPYRRFLQPTYQTWCTSQPQLRRILDRIESQASPLGAIATVLGAATVAEAYDIQSLLHDDAEADPQSWRMVNSGTIDRYCLLWGQKPLRYLKQTYLHPVILQPQQTYLSQTRQRQANQPKIIVASMTKMLECAADLQGQILAGKSTSIIQSAIALPYLLAILNSTLMSLYYRLVFAGNALQGGYLRVGTAQLRSLPIRLPTDGWDSDVVQSGIQMVERLSTHLCQETQTIDQAIDQWVYQLYGLSAQEIETLTRSQFVQ